MRLKENSQVREIIEKEWAQMFEEERDDIRQKAKEKIAEVQKENLRVIIKSEKQQ